MNSYKPPSNILVSLAVISSFLGSGISLGSLFGFAILPIRVVGIICAIWIVLKCLNDTERRLKIQYIIATYVYMIVITLLFSENYSNSVGLLLDYLCLFSAFCVVLLNTNSEYTYNKYVNLYLVCCVITIAICIYEYLTQHHVANNYTQAYSVSDWAYLHTIKAPTAFLYNPNNVAVLMIISLPLLLEKLIEKEERTSRIIWVIILFLDFAVIFMTGSRGGLLAGTIIIGAFFLASRINFWKKVILLILGVVLISYFSTFIMNQLEYGGMLKSGIFNMFLEGDGGRGTIARSSLENVFIHNPLFGSGAGAIENSNGVSAHNTIIEVLSNYGITGIAIFIFLISRLLKRLFSQNGKIVSLLLALAFFMSMFIPPTIMTVYVLFIPLAFREGRSYIRKGYEE